MTLLQERFQKALSFVNEIYAGDTADIWLADCSPADDLAYFDTCVGPQYDLSGFEVAYMYFEGVGTSVNRDEAIKWMTRAYQKGSVQGVGYWGDSKDIQALKEFARVYLTANGWGIEAGKFSPGKYTFYGNLLAYCKPKYEKSANNGCVYAAYHLALLYEQNKCMKNAVEWYEMAAQKGCLRSQLRLGNLTLSEQNEKQAIVGDHKNIEKNLSLLQYELGRMYENQLYQVGDLSVVERWWREQWNKEINDSLTQWRSLLYVMGCSDEHVVNTLKRSSWNEYSVAQIFLGGYYLYRKYHQDWKTWYDKSEAQGGVLVCCDRGLYEVSGEHPNWSNAVAYFKKAVEGKEPRTWYGNCTTDSSNLRLGIANFYLAWAYGHGLGVKKDLKKAMVYYYQAAQLGQPHAQYNVAWFYLQGYWQGDVTKNYYEAVKWYRKSREQLGRPYTASYGLALCFKNGWFVNKDLKEAVRVYMEYPAPPALTKAMKWYRKSAEQGNRDAQYAMGRLGECLQHKQDDIITWYYLAEKQGHPDATTALNGIVSTSLLVRKLMELNDSKNKKSVDMVIENDKKEHSISTHKPTASPTLVVDKVATPTHKPTALPVPVVAKVATDEWSQFPEGLDLKTVKGDGLCFYRSVVVASLSQDSTDAVKLKEDAAKYFYDNWDYVRHLPQCEEYINESRETIYQKILTAQTVDPALLATAVKLREDAAKYFYDNWDDELHLPHYPEIDNPRETIYKKIRTDQGDDAGIKATMGFLNKPIVMFKKKNGKLLSNDYPLTLTGKPIFVMYSGSGFDGHYEAAIPKVLGTEYEIWNKLKEKTGFAKTEENSNSSEDVSLTGEINSDAENEIKHENSLPDQMIDEIASDNGEEQNTQPQVEQNKVAESTVQKKPAYFNMFSKKLTDNGQKEAVQLSDYIEPRATETDYIIAATNGDDEALKKLLDTNKIDPICQGAKAIQIAIEKKHYSSVVLINQYLTNKSRKKLPNDVRLSMRLVTSMYNDLVSQADNSMKKCMF